MAFVFTSTRAVGETQAPYDHGMVPKAIATRAQSEILIDGTLDEAAWANAPLYSGLNQRQPFNDQKESEKTEFRILYDDNNLYVGIFLYDREPDQIIKRTKNFDSPRMMEDDNVSVNIDPLHDHRTVYSFTINPSGAQVDANAINNGEVYLTSWNAVWKAAVKIVPQGWVAEFEIPFTSLDYNPDLSKDLGFNVTRRIGRKHEVSHWSAIHPPFSSLQASEYGHLSGIELPHHRWRHLSLFPFVSSGFKQNPTAVDSTLPAHTIDFVLKPGIDLKYPIHRTAVAQLTVNTDFSQVDVDDQQINLNRFSLFFPEKRPFFLEGSQFFEFGEPARAQLFFSRRIGIQDDQEIPIHAGIRSYGKIHRTEFGFLDIQTDSTATIPHRNYLVARIKQDIFSRSDIGLMVIHRQDTSGPEGLNTSGGVDTTYRSDDGHLVITNWLAGTNSDPTLVGEMSGTGASAYNKTSWSPGLWEFSETNIYVSDGFNPEVGFFERVGIFEPALTVHRSYLLPESGLQQIRVGGAGNFFTADEIDQFLDYAYQGDVTVSTNAGYTYFGAAKRVSDKVLAPFVLNSQVTIPAARYDESRMEISATTPSQRSFSVSLDYSYGGFFGGTSHEWVPGVTTKPIDGLYLNVNADVSRIDIPSLGAAYFTSAANFLGNYSFSPTMSIQSNVGWNQDKSRVIFQYRYRWHFSALSDFFAVYNEERSTSNFITNFRGLIFKIVGYFSI